MILSCYVSDDDYRTLAEVAAGDGRTVEQLAESAISEAACGVRRDHVSGRDSWQPPLPLD